MNPEPQPFQEATRCDVCKCSFSTFRRRHHCRCCGRTLCHEHSSNQMPLPQFGIHTNVRVCSDCFNSFSRSNDHGSRASVERINNVAENVSRLDINGDVKDNPEPNPPQPAASINPECKCGMPLCICMASLPPAAAAPVQYVSTTSVALNSNPKKADAPPRLRRSTQDSRQGSASGSDKPQADYEVNGEGLREAIKNGDLAGVKYLLNKGVDSNYCDKQGLSLLHLAAVFNQTDIAFALMDHGARLDCKNSQAGIGDRGDTTGLCPGHIAIQNEDEDGITIAVTTKTSSPLLEEIFFLSSTLVPILGIMSCVLFSVLL